MILLYLGLLAFRDCVLDLTLLPDWPETTSILELIPEGDLPIVFDDPILENMLLDRADGNGDGVIVCSEAAAYPGDPSTSNAIIIDAFSGVTSLEGIQYFTGIQALFCYDNEVGFVPDLSGMKNMLALRLQRNRLTEFPRMPENIVDVILHRNEIAEIPEGMRYPRMDDLDLRNNLVEDVPDFINCHDWDGSRPYKYLNLQLDGNLFDEDDCEALDALRECTLRLYISPTANGTTICTP